MDNKENSTANKSQKYLIAFVDTENIAPDGDSGLISLIDYKYSDYCNVGIWCYGIEDSKSGSSVAWKKKCDESHEFYKWKKVNGPREKNKVDEAIKKDIEKLLANPKFDPIYLWVIATSDGDLASAVRHIKEKRHKVLIAYTGALSKELSNLCDYTYHL